MLRCDHCRGALGLMIHRYWRMRFCSADCAQAYQQRLQGKTKAKIRLLNHPSRANPSRGVTRSSAGFGRRSAA
jgi:hypothetical protein